MVFHIGFVFCNFCFAPMELGFVLDVFTSGTSFYLFIYLFIEIEARFGGG
jgi:hypothetical protein